jgi:uncharacterized protein
MLPSMPGWRPAATSWNERMDEDKRGGQQPSITRRCPVCGAPRVPRFRPFCSAVCRDRDLIKWLDGAYSVPAVETDEDPEGEREQEEGSGR